MCTLDPTNPKKAWLCFASFCSYFLGWNSPQTDMFQNHCYLETLRKERYILSPKKSILLIYILHIIVKSCNQASISPLTSSYLITLFYYYFSYYQPLLHHPSQNIRSGTTGSGCHQNVQFISKMVVIQWFSQTILSSQTIHYSFHFLSLPSPTPSNLLHIPPYIPLIFFLSTIKWQKLKYCYSHLKSFVFMFWIVLLMFLII